MKTVRSLVIRPFTVPLGGLGEALSHRERKLPPQFDAKRTVVHRHGTEQPPDLGLAAETAGGRFQDGFRNGKKRSLAAERGGAAARRRRRPAVERSSPSRIR